MTQFIPKSNKDLEHVVALRSTLLMIVAQLLTISSKLFKNGDCQDNELELLYNKSTTKLFTISLSKPVIWWWRHTWPKSSECSQLITKFFTIELLSKLDLQHLDLVKSESHMRFLPIFAKILNTRSSLPKELAVYRISPRSLKLKKRNVKFLSISKSTFSYWSVSTLLVQCFLKYLLLQPTNLHWTRHLFQRTLKDLLSSTTRKHSILQQKTTEITSLMQLVH